MIDKNGTKWHATLTIGKVKQIKQVTDLDILDLNKIEAIASDLDKYLDTLWILYSDSNPNKTRDEWELAINGDCLDKAATELWDAISFFSPSRKKVMDKVKNAATKQIDKALEKMESLTEDQLMEIMESTFVQSKDGVSSQDNLEQDA